MKAKEKKAVVYLWLPGAENPVPVGLLSTWEQKREERSEFAYGRKYVGRAAALSIDPEELPLEEKLFYTKEDFDLFSVLRDAAPDGWGRHVLCRNEGRAEMTEFEYLVTPESTSRIGALGFGNGLGGPGGFQRKGGRPPEVDPEDLEEMMAAVHAAQSDDDIPKKFRQYLVRGSSLGGARPKMTADYRGGKWIAKFRRDDDTFDVPRLEYATMRLAKAAGLDVPEVSLELIKGKAIFLIERFDRVKCPKKDGLNSSFFWGRRHQVSGLTALGAHESDRGRWGYRDLAEVLRKRSPTVASDLEELFRRMIFNIAVTNTDDHLRNHAFLVDASGMRLSPLYDVVPTMSELDAERFLFLKLGGGTRLASFDNAVSLFPDFLLTASRAEELVTSVLGAVKGWRDVFSDSGFTATELKKIENVILKDR